MYADNLEIKVIKRSDHNPLCEFLSKNSDVGLFW